MKRFFLILATVSLLALQACGPGRNLITSSTSTAANREIVTRVSYVFEKADIVNPGARLYLEQVDYSDDPGFTRSDVVKPEFAEGTDRPLPVTLSWEGGRATRILLSTSPLFEDAREAATEADSPVSIYNLVPGVDYYYRILDGEKVLKQGGVTPVGPLRMISTYPGSERPRRAVYNMRDLGGWRTADGRQHIAYGKVYRGSNIDNLNADPFAKDLFLKELGISVDFDLRGYKGDENDPHVDGLTYYQLPLRKNFEGGTGQTERLYKKALRQIIGWLDEGRVVYFHCAAGADRTGLLCLLLEGVLGVPENDLLKDYELTTFSIYGTRRRDGGDMTHGIPLLKEYPGATIQEKIENFFLEDGITKEEIEEYKSLMLE